MKVEYPNTLDEYTDLAILQDIRRALRSPMMEDADTETLLAVLHASLDRLVTVLLLKESDRLQPKRVGFATRVEMFVWGAVAHFHNWRNGLYRRRR